MSKILFFSSDKRELYFEDVLRVLAYPEDFCIKFRYREEWIDEETIKYKSEGIIVFLKTGENESCIPLREVTVQDYRYNESMGLYTVYLKLGKFCTCQQIEKTPNKFVYKDNVRNLQETTWIKKVEEVNELVANDYLYTHIFNISNSDNIVKPKFDETLKKSFYSLTSENNYHIKLALFDATEGNKTLILNDTNSTVSFMEHNELHIKTKLEYETITFRTNKLEVEGMVANILLDQKYKDTKDDQNCISIPIPIKIKKNLMKTFSFFVGTFVATYGLALSLEKIKFDDIIGISSSVIGVFLTAFSLTWLYYKTDKK